MMTRIMLALALLGLAVSATPSRADDYDAVLFQVIGSTATYTLHCDPSMSPDLFFGIITPLETALNDHGVTRQVMDA